VFANALFYLAHWQTYVCGVLRFTKFDVTEAQFTIMSILVISAIFGTQFWSIELKVSTESTGFDDNKSTQIDFVQYFKLLMDSNKFGPTLGPNNFNANNM
jgi:hypothetical protein